MKLTLKPEEPIDYVMQTFLGAVLLIAGVILLVGGAMTFVSMVRDFGWKVLWAILVIPIALCLSLLIGNACACFISDENVVCACGTTKKSLAAEWWHKRKCLVYLTKMG